MAKVLIVEDEIALRTALIDKLKNEHFEVFDAANGQEGLAAAREKKPDLILLDIMMPGMNGLDVLKELKSNAGLIDTPVFILTNLPEESARIKTQELGAAEYLVKSNIPIEELVNKIKSYLKK